VQINPAHDREHPVFVTLGKKYFYTGLVLVILGLVSIIYGLTKGDSLRTWQAYLVNFLFWSGIGISGVVFAAVLDITNARWGRPLKRIAEIFGTFLPISFILFLILYFGRIHLFSWIENPVHGKESWLNFPFMFLRNGAGLLLLYGFGLIYLYNSVRPDTGFVKERSGSLSNKYSGLFIRKWKGTEKEIEKREKRKMVLSTLLILAYCIVFTLLAFDLVMSLDPHWYSTLFGLYYFTGNLYLGFAVIAVVSIIIRRVYKLSGIIVPKVFHDLGKLVFAFCILTADFFYTQFLVIWYGNLPEETRYIIERSQVYPWKYLSWAVLVFCFVIPFFILLFRKLKTTPFTFFIASCIIIAGMWLERFLLVVPTLWKGEGFPFGILEVCMTAGFAGLFLVVTGYGYSLFPVVPVPDPLIAEK